MDKQEEEFRIRHFDEIRSALLAVVSGYRTFREVPKSKQEWTSFDDNALDNAFRVLDLTEKWRSFHHRMDIH